MATFGELPGQAVTVWIRKSLTSLVSRLLRRLMDSFGHSATPARLIIRSKCAR